MYELLAKHYSKLFPSDKERCNFIINEADLSESNKKTIIDAGCANGDLAFELAECGYRVTGIDPDNTMIQEAIQRRGTEPNPVFISVGMDRISSLGETDAVTCFGNTLPHLKSEQDVLLFFKDTSSILNSGGRLIFQIINFDRLEGKNTFDFPDLDTGDFLFKRSYKRRSDGRIDFEITLTNKETGESVSDKTALLPILRSNLITMLQEAGFTDIKAYSDYSKTSADGSEFATIYSASL